MSWFNNPSTNKQKTKGEGVKQTIAIGQLYHTVVWKRILSIFIHLSLCLRLIANYPSPRVFPVSGIGLVIIIRSEKWQQTKQQRTTWALVPYFPPRFACRDRRGNMRKIFQRQKEQCLFGLSAAETRRLQSDPIYYDSQYWSFWWFSAISDVM